MARILLGVSGGISAYKSLELARLATIAGHGVRVLMSEGATRFVGAASFEAIVGAPVLISEFERDPLRGAFPGEPGPAHDPIGHLELAANADAYLIAPASANTIAKLAAGLADSMLTTSFLGCGFFQLIRYSLILASNVLAGSFWPSQASLPAVGAAWLGYDHQSTTSLP